MVEHFVGMNRALAEQLGQVAKGHQYTTYEDTMDFIRKQRRKKMTFAEALAIVQEEDPSLVLRRERTQKENAAGVGQHQRNQRTPSGGRTRRKKKNLNRTAWSPEELATDNVLDAQPMADL